MKQMFHVAETVANISTCGHLDLTKKQLSGATKYWE